MLGHLLFPRVASSMLGHLLFPRVAGLLLGHMLLPRVLHEHTLSALLQPLLLCLHLRLGGEVGLLCSVLLLFRHVMHAATIGRDSPAHSTELQCGTGATAHDRC